LEADDVQDAVAHEDLVRFSAVIDDANQELAQLAAQQRELDDYWSRLDQDDTPVEARLRELASEAADAQMEAANNPRDRELATRAREATERSAEFASSVEKQRAETRADRRRTDARRREVLGKADAARSRLLEAEDNRREVESALMSGSSHDRLPSHDGCSRKSSGSLR
jgi:chromosome segregation ATPase